MANGQTKTRCRFCNNRFKRQGMHKHEEFCADRPQESASIRASSVVHKQRHAAQSLKTRLIGIKSAIDVLLKEKVF
jgi:hypothetical protein